MRLSFVVVVVSFLALVGCLLPTAFTVAHVAGRYRLESVHGLAPEQEQILTLDASGDYSESFRDTVRTTGTWAMASSRDELPRLFRRTYDEGGGNVIWLQSSGCPHPDSAATLRVTCLYSPPAQWSPGRLRFGNDSTCRVIPAAGGRTVGGCRIYRKLDN